MRSLIWSWRALAFACLALLHQLSSERLIRSPLPNPLDHSFDLQPISAPKLSGVPLQIVAACVQLPWIGPFLVGYLMNDNGYSAVREWAAAVDDEPIYHPFVPPTAEQRSRASETALHASMPSTLSREYASGATTPVQVAERVLTAIQASRAGPTPLGAFLAVDSDGSLMEAARASAERWRAGRPLSAIDGVPVAVKDEIDVRGYATFQGTRFLGLERQPNASADALPVARLRRAGALIVGKTVMVEIGIGTTGHNIHHGTPRNPFPAHDAYPGGSSAGSAVAVASGLVPLAIAADGGGSVRIPSALCGVVGLKPTAGRVPCANDLDFSVGVIGPMGHDAAAAAAMYLAMAGAETEDAAGAVASGGAAGTRRSVLAAMGQHQPPPHLARFDDVAHLGGVRIGVFPPLMEAAEPAVVAANIEMLRRLESRGAVLVNVTLPSLMTLFKAHTITILSEFATAMDAYHPVHARDFALDTQIKLALARGLTARDLLAAQKVRARWVAELDALFGQIDVLASPATAVAAPPLQPTETVDLQLTEQIMRFSPLANLAGIPAISFPVGQMADGRPLAMMLQARWWDEDVLLRLARAAEELREPMARPHRYFGPHAPPA